VRVLLDRVDAVQKRLQFSILDEEAESAARPQRPSKSGKATKKKSRAKQVKKSMQQQSRKPHPSLKKVKHGKRR
jgi:ribonuclease R